jgi:hypothetical protein
LSLAEEALELSGFMDNWNQNSKLFDPAFGQGDLFTAVQNASPGFPVDPSQLMGIDRESSPVSTAFRVLTGDFFDTETELFSHIFTNPPWVTFQDLPEEYKPKAKQIFHQYLKLKSSNLLLGLSRADLAGPYLIKILREHCLPESRVLAFLPATLFFGHGANAPFLQALSQFPGLLLRGMWDCGTAKAFPEVNTRAVLAYWHLGERDSSSDQVRFKKIDQQNHGLNQDSSFVIQEPKGWRIQNHSSAAPWMKPKVKSPPPRQGVNTCGANEIYFLKDKAFDSEQIFPLYDRKRNPGRSRRWLVIPHDPQTGKPLNQEDIHGGLWAYLLNHRKVLVGRKGLLIGSQIRKGYWWALQGVGPYTFAPYKIVWRALGTKTFDPELISPWKGMPQIPHQSLYTYLSFWDREKALEALEVLKNPRIQKELDGMQGAGTKNFAQPGRIKALIEFVK